MRKGRSSFLAGALALSAACASSNVTWLSADHPPAKPTPCDLRVYRTEDEVHGAYEKLCAIAVDEKPLGTRAYDFAADGRARGKVEDAACRCGADAIIVRQLGRGNYRATAIRFQSRTQ